MSTPIDHHKKTPEQVLQYVKMHLTMTNGLYQLKNYSNIIRDSPMINSCIHFITHILKDLEHNSAQFHEFERLLNIFHQRNVLWKTYHPNLPEEKKKELFEKDHHLVKLALGIEHQAEHAVADDAKAAKNRERAAARQQGQQQTAVQEVTHWRPRHGISRSLILLIIILIAFALFFFMFYKPA